MKEPKVANQKRRPGRPTELAMPDRIADTPRNVARAIMQGPPMKDWPYLQSGSGAKVKHNEKMRSDDA